MRGCIVKRGKNAWALVIELPRDPTGKRRQKWYPHQTRREAEVHLTQIKSAMDGGLYAPPTKLTVAEYLDQWLHDYADSHVGPLTLANYRMIIDRHLKPAFGTDPLLTLSGQAIDRYCGAKVRTGLAPSTVQKHYVLIHEVLEQAVRWGLLMRNAADQATPPRAEPFDSQPWDEEETRLFLGEAKRSSRYYPLYLTAILTGMRLGELLGLRWEDVDLATNQIQIRQSVSRLGKQILFKKPKSRSSQRTIALPAAVGEALRDVQRAQAEARAFFGDEYRDHGLVFCQPNGNPLHGHNLTQRDFRSVITRAKVRRIRFHDLRHGHCSALARAGVSIKVAQERMGHSNPALTLRVYTHTLAGQHEEAARAVEGLLLGKDG